MRLTGSFQTIATHGRSTTSSRSGRSSSAGAVTELLLQHLPGGVARQLVEHRDLARHREAGQLAAHELLEVVLVDRLAGRGDDVRDEADAVRRVLPLDDGHL